MQASRSANSKLLPGPAGRPPLAKWSILLGLILAVVGLSAARSIARYDLPEVAEFDRTHAGQFDFHNGVYYPTRAFLEGVSPYGEQYTAKYPVTRPMPLMSPLLFCMHAPIASLPIGAASSVYFLINCLLMLAIAWLSVHWIQDSTRRTTWLLVAWLLVAASRAGHTTLFTGYLTAWMVVGTLLALAYARQHWWLSALGVAVSSCKPTYAIPLFLLMIARGNYKPAFYGLGLSIAGVALGLARLLWVSTPAQLWADLQHGQMAHMEDAFELPINTWTRIDSLAVAAKWLAWQPSEVVHLIVMAALLSLPAVALWRLQFTRADYSCAGLSSGIIAVSILSTVYHHVYDALLLFPVAIGLALNQPSTVRGPARVRWVLAGLLLLVAWNYPSSEMFLKGSVLTPENHRLVTSTGPVALAAAWLGLCALPWLGRDRSVELPLA